MTTDKIGLAIPCVYENFFINKYLILLMQHSPEYFYENIKIDAIFGNFPYCIWDGGRKAINYTYATIEEIKQICLFYNNYDIPIRFIYTNNQIQKEHLDNRFCNLVTSICENNLNEIVINSPILEEYIRKTYPSYKIISSTTKCLTDKTLVLNELNKEDYYRVCLDYNLNYDIDFLNNLNEQQKNKVELLANALCGINCTNRINHYKLNSLSALHYGKNYELDYCNLINRHHLYPCESQLSSMINIQQILTTYKNIGIKHFKLEGRLNTPIVHILNIIRYLVKPEYQLYIISEIYSKMERNNILNDSYY